ncbi:hypothetical protein A2841_04000 [Candidatus Kaiserbacteria bacterium RIFCSPHIGHO2_01_FULL_48_10]|uniref:HIT domain-containing protein n=1 Tax=Candidatus Kaiserbacteria bacterium RIFCSPHIGHO2_01_FULL_48_10 TaxID=1798476 RepID=A0A1F6C4L9_9BACT|nr:MAG: hypothetical protein A2841_04000 [Candidatus Kaiserbacteria bacterium RIFCSPHIGHO2_01_FULL_48_10]
MENCVFCKIISGALPTEKIYEDEETFAFLDIKPINPGHVLVVSKAHYRNVFDLPEPVWLAMMKTTHRLVPIIKETTSAGGINISMNNERPAHQLVFHAHVHIIPRFEGDPYKTWVGKEYREGEKTLIAEKIKEQLEQSGAII